MVQTEPNKYATHENSASVNSVSSDALTGENELPYASSNALHLAGSHAHSPGSGSNTTMTAAPDRKPEVLDYKLTSTPRILLITTLVLLILRAALSVYEFNYPAATNPAVHWQDAGTLGGTTEPGLIKASGKKFIIYEFYADWCSPCKRLEHDVLTNNEIRNLMEKNFVCIRVTDRQREDGKNSKLVTDLQKRHRVFAFPTLVIVGPDSETKGQLVGNSSSLAVYRFLSRTLAKPGS